MRTSHSRAGIVAVTVLAGVTAASIAAVAIAAAPRTFLPSSAGTQIEAGALATWADLSTWTRPAAGAPGRTEFGVGLVLAGPDGDMRLAFYVVRPDRRTGATRPPGDVGVRAASGALMNPNLLRRPVLTITYGDPDEEAETIDLSQAMTVDNPAPGAAVTSGVASIAAERFIEVVAADDISANIFGATVTLRRDQIEALRAFRDRFFPPAR